MKITYPRKGKLRSPGARSSRGSAENGRQLRELHAFVPKASHDRRSERFRAHLDRQIFEQIAEASSRRARIDESAQINILAL
jgi:hypothetical protein